MEDKYTLMAPRQSVGLTEATASFNIEKQADIWGDALNCWEVLFTFMRPILSTLSGKKNWELNLQAVEYVVKIGENDLYWTVFNIGHFFVRSFRNDIVSFAISYKS